MKKDSISKELSKLRGCCVNFHPLFKKAKDTRCYETDKKYLNALTDYRKRTEKKLSISETRALLKEYEYKFQGNKTSKRIFNRLISDAECLKKIVFVSDGSFRTQRIAVVASGDIIVECKSVMYSTTFQSEREVLKAFHELLRIYPVIFVQIENNYIHLSR